MRKPGALDRVAKPDPPLADVIDRLIAESERNLGRTKIQVLRAIKDAPIGRARSSTIGSAEIVAYVKTLDVLPLA